MGLIMQEGKFVSRDEVARVDTPNSTDTWRPVPHIDVIEAVTEVVRAHDWDIEGEKFGLAREGQKMFGVMEISRSSSPEWHRCIGIRNSHDKSFAVGLSAGIVVCVCTNMAFGGTTVIKRRHTNYEDSQKLVEHIKNAVNNKEVGLIVIDKLTALSKECYADAIQDYSQKLLASFPDVAILWIHHSNEENKPSGGNSVTGVPTFLISIDHDAKDGKNLHLKLDGNQLYLDEEKDVTICIQKNTFTLVSPTRSEDEMKELVLEAYSNKNGAFRMNQNDAAKLLGYSDASAFRKKDSAIKTTSRKKTRTAGKK